jgi:glycosyltransferase involved in cell wall biosynthesis
VVSLTTVGTIGLELQKKGVNVVPLNLLRSGLNLPIVFCRLMKLIFKLRPDVVQTWMYHANLVGGIAAYLAGCKIIIWSIRSTDIPRGWHSLTYWLVRICAKLSYIIPDSIVCCANSAKKSHIKLSYAENKLTVIPNGYDFQCLTFNQNSRLNVRQELGVSEMEIVIGVVGRFDPLKDYKNFINAAAIIIGKRSGIKFLMIGEHNDWSNSTICKWLDELNLRSSFYLIGQQADIPSYLAAMDIFCLSSISEGFPNVVVEAMAVGLPCIVTRAGDAADIVEDDSFVVPVNDPAKLAEALLLMCNLNSLGRKSIGNLNAKKVRDKYDINKIYNEYQSLYNLF